MANLQAQTVLHKLNDKVEGDIGKKTAWDRTQSTEY